MIDTHCHLYADEFQEDRSEAILRAKVAGVTGILLPNIDTESIPSLEKLYLSDTQFFKPMMGLHPCSVKENWEEELEQIRLKLFDNRTPWIAVGEIGLDYFWDKTLIPQQQQAFLTQCQWACELNLPIAIHSRDATDNLIELLTDLTPRPKGVFHCFTGTAEQAQQIIELGFYLGIGGVVSFKNSGLKETIAQVGIEKVVMETDAPYLAPVPYRGKRNEPSYLKLVVGVLAESLQIPESEVIMRTTVNARALFNLQ